VYKIDTLRKATDYIGSLILENDTLQFIQTAEGRVVPKNVDGVDKNEYQYHLKDHLGNVRSTFAVRDDDYATGFETATNPYFDNYDEITILSNPLKKSGTYAHRLTGGGTNIVGLMKSLYVSKGDRIRAEVYAKYLDAQFTNDGINGAALINALVSMLGGGTLTGEGTVIENNLNTDFISAAMADGSQETSPKAYLNYILLDKNFNYLNSGFERLGSSAADPGDGSGTHQRLSFEEILVQEDGYLMVFLSNESDQSVEVFWDDFRVDHHYNAVLQADDYYPFGLTFNSYQRSYSKANNFKYNQGTGDKTFQGSEGRFFRTERVPELGWDLTKFRMYDYALGRFLNVDPLADIDLNYRWSTYSYSFNNPIRWNDPYGDCPTCVDDIIEGFKAFGEMMARNFSFKGNDNEQEKSNNGYQNDDLEVVLLGSGGDQGSLNERSSSNTWTIELDDVITLGGAIIKQAYKDIKLPKVDNNKRTVSNPSEMDGYERIGDAFKTGIDAAGNMDKPEAPDTTRYKNGNSAVMYNDGSLILLDPNDKPISRKQSGRSLFEDIE
jgi:RHS repeat-associated protein